MESKKSDISICFEQIFNSQVTTFSSAYRISILNW